VRTCSNGALSGSFTNQACAVSNGGRVNGSGCSLSCACASNFCGQFYPDADGDGHGARNSAMSGFCATDAATAPTGASTVADDCCDSDVRTYPNESSYYATANACGTFDYNCDGSNTQQYPSGYGGLLCTAANHCPGQTYMGVSDLMFSCPVTGPFTQGWGNQINGDAYAPATTPPACGSNGTLVTSATQLGPSTQYTGCGVQTYWYFTVSATTQSCR
jgi:hypothetical protein